MLNVKFSGFFDRPEVVKRVRDGTKSVLSRAGAFIRTRARSSIRKRNRSAEPGQPPSDHGGWLKKLLFFAYDAATHSVVVGPLLFRKQSPTAPLLLEEGGTVKHWRTGEPATYSAFPYMKPAMEAERPKFPELFTNSIK
jgi:hypothetical protein